MVEKQEILRYKSVFRIYLFSLYKFSVKLLKHRLQSTLVISKSKGPAETLRDIRTLTYQMCRIEEIQPNFTNEHVM